MCAKQTQEEDILTKGTDSSIPAESSSTFFVDSTAVQLRLCDALTAKKEFDRVHWVQSATVYLQRYYRFRYADISNFIYARCQEAQQEDIINSNLDSVYQYIQQEYDQAPLTRQDEFRRIIKFYDHVNLALHQRHLVSSSKQEIRRAVDSEIKDATTKATEGILSQLVGLVAMFTALSFVLFGGISSLQSIFDFLGGMVNAESRWFCILPPIIVALLWCFCMVNLLFVFVLFILRIMNRSLHDGEGNSLSGRMTTLEALRRFPILIILDYGLFVAVSLLTFLYISAVTTTGSRWLFNITGSVGNSVFIIIGVLLILSYIAIGAFIHCKILNMKEKSAKAEKEG